MERFKELGFGVAAVGFSAATVGVFIVIWLKGAAYIYENVKWILYLELSVSVLYLAWAIERLVNDIRK